MRCPLPIVVTTLAASAVLASLAISVPAAATSGFGCYRINTGAGDPLVIREGPTARSASLGAFHSDNQPIIALGAGLTRGEGVQPELVDVHFAELEVCTPQRLPLGARWCPVTLYDGGGSVEGWVKRRFVDHSECP